MCTKLPIKYKKTSLWVTYYTNEIMKITNGMSDSAIANELFNRLDARRKSLKMSQQEMAERIGITRKSYAAIGSGTCKLTTLISLLRHLDLLDNLDHIITPAGVSPMASLLGEVQSKHTRLVDYAAVLNSTRVPIKKGETLNPIKSMRKRNLIKG